MNLSDNIILDIQKIARERNTNWLSLNEYMKYGGKYDFANEEIESEIGSFANAVELAGLKVGNALIL